MIMAYNELSEYPDLQDEEEPSEDETEEELDEEDLGEGGEE